MTEHLEASKSEFLALVAASCPPWLKLDAPLRANAPENVPSSTPLVPVRRPKYPVMFGDTARTSLGTTGVTCLHKCPDLFMRLTATEEEAQGLTRDLLDLVSTSMLHEALQCMDHQLWFNPRPYFRSHASSFDARQSDQAGWLDNCRTSVNGA